MVSSAKNVPLWQRKTKVLHLRGHQLGDSNCLLASDIRGNYNHGVPVVDHLCGTVLHGHIDLIRVLLRQEQVLQSLYLHRQHRESHRIGVFLHSILRLRFQHKELAQKGLFDAGRRNRYTSNWDAEWGCLRWFGGLHWVYPRLVHFRHRVLFRIRDSCYDSLLRDILLLDERPCSGRQEDAEDDLITDDHDLFTARSDFNKCWYASREHTKWKLLIDCHNALEADISSHAALTQLQRTSFCRYGWTWVRRQRPQIVSTGCTSTIYSMSLEKN